MASSHAWSRQVIGSEAQPTRRATGPPARAGAVLRGEPACRAPVPPSSGAGSASHRVAGIVTSSTGIPMTISARPPPTAFRMNSTSAGTASTSCAAAYAVMRSRLGGVGTVPTSWLTGCILPDRRPASGGAGTTPVRVLAPLIGAAFCRWIEVIPERHRGDVMSDRNPLTQIPIRAARWSATHPWRAMLGWLVFVAGRRRPGRRRADAPRPRTPTTGWGSRVAPTPWCTGPGSRGPRPRTS